MVVPRVPVVPLQIDAVLIANPTDCFWRQHLAALLHAKSGKILCVLVEPTTESICAHSSGFCQFVFIHRFHATKLLKINDIRKFFARFFHQFPPISAKDFQCPPKTSNALSNYRKFVSSMKLHHAKMHNSTRRSAQFDTSKKIFST